MSICMILLGSYTVLALLSLAVAASGGGTAASWTLAVAVTLVAGGCGWLCYRFVVRPLRLLTEYVEAIRREPTTARVGIQFNAEVGELQRGIVALNKEIVASVEQERENRDQEIKHAKEVRAALEKVSRR